MPINPNIALGVQPIQQPNMLGQMGQIMALKAAQQETEGYEGVKGAIASGMSPNDPRMLQFGPRGIAAYKAAGEGAVKQQELLTKSFENNLKGFGAVRSPEDLINYSVGQLSDLYVGPWLKSRGITAEKLTANLQRDIATFGFDAVLKKSAMGLEKFYTDETSRVNAATAAGPANRQAALAERTYEDKLNYGGELVTTTIPNPENPKERIEIQTRRDLRGNRLIPLEVAPMPMRVDISPSSATSAYQPLEGGGGTPNVLATQVAPQGGGAAAPIVNGLNPNAPQAAPTFAQPKPTFRAPVAAMVDGKPVLVAADKAMGLPPATDFTIKQATGREETVRSLDAAIRNLELVVKPGGLLEKSTGSGAGRLYDTAKGFFGGSTEGAIAAAELAPIADLVLKMVPRFEGPQGVKDVESYERAAGRLADAGLPNDIRAGAAKIILKLMKERKDQFAMKGQEGGSGGASAAPKTVTRTGTLNGRKVVEYSDGTTAYAD